MALIKTVNEVALERLNECVDTLSRKYLESVRAIYGATDHGRPEHIGSCVLIEYQGTKYLVTAAHVIDNNAVTSLYVTGEKSLVLITGTVLTTTAKDDKRKNDKNDFAVIPISDSVASELGNLTYLTDADWELGSPPANDRFGLALGFPNSRNKKVDNLTKAISPEPFVYSSSLILDASDNEKSNYQPDRHYLLDYSEKHSKDAQGKLVNSIAAKGVSGGGLFLICGLTNPENLPIGSPCKGKLLGILIEYAKARKALVFTRITLVIEAIAAMKRL